MASITFIEHDQTEHIVQIEDGKSLMELAMDQGVPGIDADCGGECACGTCHVMIGEAWASKIEAPDHQEITLLAMTPDKQDTSRLSCQVTSSEALDGMQVHLPEFQM